MASFTVRVELHGADAGDYERLHTLMASYGFNRTLGGTEKSGASSTFRMPSGEYTHDSEADVFAVRDTAKLVADAVKPGAWVLVTQASARAWHMPKIWG